MKVLYLDESGDHNLRIIDPQYPVFVLGGVIMEQEYAEGEATKLVNDFKNDIFGRTDIILHTADISRNRNGFEGMISEGYKANFRQKLNSLMRELKYKVVACAIRKKDLLARYEFRANDPYILSLHMLIERFCLEIGGFGNKGVIIAESRGPFEDRKLGHAWEGVRQTGAGYTRPDRIADAIDDFQIRLKQENITGLQLADLVVSPIGRHVLGKADHEDWRIILEKFRRSPQGAIEGYGLKIFP